MNRRGLEIVIRRLNECQIRPGESSMRKLFSALPLLILLVFGMVGQASAQSSWLPSYSASERVYVAPGVDNSLRSAFESSSVAADIRQQAAVHNLNVLVVVTVSGDDAGTDARQSGPVLVRKLWDSWIATSGFSKERVLVILLTGDGQQITSVGVRAGDYLNRQGIVRNTMSDQNGPVIPVLRANLSSNPSAVPAGIVERVNAIVTAKVGTAAPVNSGDSGTPVSPPSSSTSSEGNSSMSLGTILLIVAGGVVLFLVIRAIAKSGSSSSSSTPADTGFQARLDAERRARAAITARYSVPATGASTPAGTTDPHATNSPGGSNGVNTALAVGAGVVAGSVIADQVRRRNDEEEADRRRREDTTTTTTTSDSGSVAPVIAASCSSTSSGSSCSSSSGSSCGGGGSSCGGGGSSCGGGS
ncbi:MAG: hypothetical protein IAF58_02300 [Leptolyngbya sp.]|nr:hypothetical protein [Candidatus Melainabacteria bacterium]